MNTRILIAALVGVSLVTVAAGAYAYRNRTIAMNAWAEYDRLKVAFAKAQQDNAVAISAVAKSTETKLDLTNRRLYSTAIRADAGLPITGSIDPAAADAAVRDWIHRTNVVGSSTLTGISGRTIYARVGTEEGALLCSGMAMAHVWAMETLGLKARYVELGGKAFLSGKDRYQTHAVSEVFYDDRWHISDPTFNISVDCSDGSKHLSVKDAFACLDRGGDLVGVNGKTTNTGKTLADFGGKYSDYYGAYELAASPVSDREMFPSDKWIQEALAKYGIVSTR